MVIVSPKDRGPRDRWPDFMAVINGGDPDYLLNGMILQVFEWLGAVSETSMCGKLYLESKMAT